MKGLERTVTEATTKPPGKRQRRWPALIGGLVIALLKSETLGRALFHRGGLIVFCAVGLAVGVLKAGPVTVAATAALLVALLVGAHSLGLGLTLGFGGFALLMALFFAISTVLHIRQRQPSRRRRR